MSQAEPGSPELSDTGTEQQGLPRVLRFALELAVQLVLDGIFCLVVGAR